MLSWITMWSKKMTKTRMLSTKRMEVLHPVFEGALLLLGCSLFEPNRIVTEIRPMSSL